VSPVRSTPVSPLPSDAVALGEGELGRWQQRNVQSTLPHVIEELRRAGNLENLETVAAGMDRPYRGRYPFLDTDVYKTLEAVAYAEAGAPDPATRAFYEEAVDLIERAQRSDGYLNSAFQNPQYGREPWSDLTWGHELYNLGHLLQAGIAAARQLGDGRLLAVGRRFADLAVERFGPDGAAEVCGHPEVEMALVELHRETGEDAYLDLARRFIDRRGRGSVQVSVFEADYFQDAEPLRTLSSVTGHAVRMGYLAAGATDVAVETGDTALLAALERLFADMVATKLHFTGGLGSRHTDESIGDRFELTPDRSYSETCAAIATMQWAWRLFLGTGRAEYADLFEWVLYNAYAAGLSVDGTCFFYDNALQRRADHAVPPNVARWTAELQEHLAGRTEDGLVLAQYTAATIEAGELAVRIDTEYPWDGAVRIRVLRAPAAPTRIRLRVPGWTDGGQLRVNGVRRAVEAGWVDEVREWLPGDELELILPMPVRAHRGHPHLDAVRGAAAIARGPLAYCLEGLDTEQSVDDLLLDQDALAGAREEPGEQPLRHVALALELAVAAPAAAPLYPPLASVPVAPEGRVGAVLRPYFLWGNREASPMRVWLRTE
jgi:uncharacterized protein